MIYGLNFNGTQIPIEYSKKFVKELKLAGQPRGVYAHLVGVTDTMAERDTMLIAASNGHRKLHVVERSITGGYLYGIYAY